MIDSILFLFKCAFKNIYKNYLLTFASMSVLCISLLVFGSSILIYENTDNFIREIGDESQVVVFLDETLTTEQINEIHKNLLQIQNIKNVNFESKEMALQNYLESMGESAELFSDVSSDILRNSFIFNIKDLSKFDQTLFEVEKIDGIARIRERREVVNKINEVGSTLLLFSAIIFVIFAAASALIIYNIVKISVYSRRVEINIMKYVGATDFFIQMPHFIEGIIIGIFSGILSAFLQYFIYTNILSPVIYDLGLFTPISISGQIFMGTVVFIVIGAVIGVIGSVIPVKKYLNV